MNRYSKYSKSLKGKERSNRYKERNKNKVSAQNKALYSYKEKRLCSIKDCDNIAERHHCSYEEPTNVLFLCRKHHLEIHGKIKGVCSVCGNPQHAKGLCKKHYAQKYREQQGW